MITKLVVMLALAAPLAGAVDAALRARALAVSTAVLASGERWTKVHAAEAVIAAGDPAAARRAFERELEAHRSEPQYRVGIWRVLAQAAPTDAVRDGYVRRIVAAFLDASGPDRLHASETLGKLRYRAAPNEIEAFEAAARTGDSPLAANALWVLANSDRPDAEKRLGKLLQSKDAGTQATAAYAVRYLSQITPDTFTSLLEAVVKGSEAPIVRVSLASAAFAHAAGNQKSEFRRSLQTYARQTDPDLKIEACGAIATAGDASDLATVTALLDDGSADVRAAAAHAIFVLDARR
jgi:hypothetical protein